MSIYDYIFLMYAALAVILFVVMCFYGDDYD